MNDLPPVMPSRRESKTIDFAALDLRLAGHAEVLDALFYEMVERSRSPKPTGSGVGYYLSVAMQARKQYRAAYQVLVARRLLQQDKAPVLAALRLEAVCGPVE